MVSCFCTESLLFECLLFSLLWNGILADASFVSGLWASSGSCSDGEHRLLIQLRNRRPGWVSVCRVKGASHARIGSEHRAEPQNQGELFHTCKCLSEHLMPSLWVLFNRSELPPVIWVDVCALWSSTKSSKCHSPQNVTRTPSLTELCLPRSSATWIRCCISVSHLTDHSDAHQRFHFLFSVSFAPFLSFVFPFPSSLPSFILNEAGGDARGGSSEGRGGGEWGAGGRERNYTKWMA